jgi:CDP-diacylglycerol---glycerol-3-phosphate 3-phosphatidyltransferase
MTSRRSSPPDKLTRVSGPGQASDRPPAPGGGSTPSSAGGDGKAAPTRSGADGQPNRDTAAEIRAIARQRLIDSRLTPNAISLTGFALNLVAAGLIVAELFVLGAVAFAVGSCMDALDGRYSRMSGKGTQFGAFLDSTLDRVEEGLVLAAVGVFFASQGDEPAVAATVVTVLGSLMVSYTRARAEALGVECKVGLATRPVRVVILSAGLLFAKGASLGDFELLEPAIYAMALLTTITVMQRVFHVRSALNRAAAE